MAVVAYIETHPDQPEQMGRARLRFQPAATTGLAAEVLVHNISATEFVIEGDVLLSRNDDLDVSLPYAGTVAATVVWASQRLRGCKFRTPISAATLGAAVLRDAVAPDAEAPSDGVAGVESFGHRLHELRVAKGLTQSQLARQLRVSEPSISHWEKDRSRPKTGRLEALSLIFGVPMPELLGYDDTETLRKLVDAAKEQIARAAGTSVEKIRIMIDM